MQESLGIIGKENGEMLMSVYEEMDQYRENLIDKMIQIQFKEFQNEIKIMKYDQEELQHKNAEEVAAKNKLAERVKELEKKVKMQQNEIQSMKNYQ